MPPLTELFSLADPALVAVLLVISIVEVRTGSIPNLLVLGAILAWLGVTVVTGDWLWSLGGAVLAFVCAVTFWQRGWLGGGVAKAALPIGGLLGLVGASVVVASVAVMGLVLVRRAPGSSGPFMPVASLFCLLFVIGRVGVAALRLA